MIREKALKSGLKKCCFLATVSILSITTLYGLVYCTEIGSLIGESAFQIVHSALQSVNGFRLLFHGDFGVFENLFMTQQIGAWWSIRIHCPFLFDLVHAELVHNDIYTGAVAGVVSSVTGAGGKNCSRYSGSISIMACTACSG
jgi:hypothetical protein